MCILLACLHAVLLILFTTFSQPLTLVACEDYVVATAAAAAAAAAVNTTVYQHV
jgi:hypothetical protein